MIGARGELDGWRVYDLNSNAAATTSWNFQLGAPDLGADLGPSDYLTRITVRGVFTGGGPERELEFDPATMNYSEDNTGGTVDFSFMTWQVDLPGGDDGMVLNNIYAVRMEW